MTFSKIFIPCFFSKKKEREINDNKNTTLLYFSSNEKNNYESNKQTNANVGKIRKKILYNPMKTRDN